MRVPRRRPSAAPRLSLSADLSPLDSDRWKAFPLLLRGEPSEPNAGPEGRPPHHSVPSRPNTEGGATACPKTYSGARFDAPVAALENRRPSVGGQQAAAQPPGEALSAVSHHPVVVPLEDRAGDRRQQVHPRLGRVH